MIELHVVTSAKLYAHAANTRASDIFCRFHFDAFSTIFDCLHLYDMYAFSISIHFQERFQIVTFAMNYCGQKA